VSNYKPTYILDWVSGTGKGGQDYFDTRIEALTEFNQAIDEGATLVKLYEYVDREPSSRYKVIKEYNLGWEKQINQMVEI